MAIKHSRQGIALGAVAALGVAMLGASPAFASGDADFVDLHLVASANGVSNALIGDGVMFTVEWDADVNTQNFDKLKYKVLSAVNEAGEDTYYDIGYVWSYYDSYEDDVEFESAFLEDIWSDDDYTYDAMFAGAGTDYEDAGNGYVGLYDYDATNEDIAEDNEEFYISWDDHPQDEEYLEAPWVWVDSTVGDTKSTVRLQAWVDSNDNDVADGNEVRSAVTAVNLYDRDKLTGTVSQKNVPGWFFPEITGGLVLDQKLNSWDPSEDWGTDYEIDENGIYYLGLQQVTTDGNDVDEYDFFSLDSNYTEDEEGWTVHEDGTVTYDYTFSYENEGSKVNKLWFHNEDIYLDSGSVSAARISNLATFGYVADSKIVKRSNTTAKMYAFDILNAGKVDFRHNGRVIASIDMVEGGDPRALADGNRPYFVRTVNFVRGKNTLEVVVNGKVLKKHTYTLRSGMA